VNQDRRKLFVGIGGLVLRLWLAYHWISAGIPKIFGAGSEVWVGSKAGVAVSGFLKGALAKAQFDAVKNPMPEVSGWYADVITSLILPNATLFSYMVTVGEVLVGLALLFGIFTRFSLVMGLTMNLNYLLAGTSSLNPFMLIVSLVLLLGGGAVRRYSLDTLIQPRLARILSQRRRQTPSGSPTPATS
jgi:thiosulfate dehydrogenase (quinone) large subunit